MPIFEYTCRDCDKNFEELVSGANETVCCPFCHSTNIERRLSVFAASASSGSTGPACSTGGCGSGFS